MINRFVSVIIPVFNDRHRLKICLTALEEQTYDNDNYEVIVVDNDSDESLEDLVDEFAQAKLAYCKIPGSYAARNHGIALAQGEILAFTDSDCIPQPDWLETGVERLVNTSNCGLVAGRIELFFQNCDRPNVVELYDWATFFHQQQYIEAHKYGATANVFSYKSVFVEVGLFDSQLKSGGDMEWGQRVFAHGYDSVYAAEVCIAHPARHSFKQMYRKVARVRSAGYKRARASQPLMVYLMTILPHLKPPLSSTRSKLTRLSQANKLENSLQKIQMIGLIFVLYYLGFFAQGYSKS